MASFVSIKVLYMDGDVCINMDQVATVRFGEISVEATDESSGTGKFAPVQGASVEVVGSRLGDRASQQLLVTDPESVERLRKALESKEPA